MAEEQDKEVGSFFDELEGGEETSHSPEDQEAFPVEDSDVSEKAEAEGFAPEENEPFLDDSANSEERGAEPEAEEKTPQEETSAVQKPSLEEENAKLKAEIEGLRKRFHDTQSAMHKAAGERSRLQKELSELKSKQESSDDWFSEEDGTRVKEIESELKRNEEETERVIREAEEISAEEKEAAWDAAVQEVKKSCPDFEKVVYDMLVPLLDEKDGNPQVRAAWLNLPDKSPLETYKFAKRIDDILAFQRDPEGYKAKLRKEIEEENQSRTYKESPTGKEGLDQIQSAEFPEENKKGGTFSFVDTVFG